MGITLTPDPASGPDRIALAFGDTGNLGYVDCSGQGILSISSLLTTLFGVNTNATWPGAAFTESFRIRSNGTVAAIGVNGWDPSTTAAMLQLNSATAATDPLWFRKSGLVPTTPLDGGMSYDNTGLRFTHFVGGVAARETVAMGPAVTTATVTPGSITLLTTFESPDIAVTGMQTGDLVKVTPPASLEAGLIWCWVAGGSAGTVRIRIFNSAATSTPFARTWTFQVEHGNS